MLFLFIELKRAMMPLMGIDDVYGEKAYGWMHGNEQQEGKSKNKNDEEELDL